MKKLSLINKLIFFINSIFATVLLLSYALPFISPKSIALVAVLSLFVPILIVINFIFFVYWLIKLKKQWFLSGLVLVIGWIVSSPFYQLSEKNTALNTDIKVMSYNVRTFNYYKWNKDKTIVKKMLAFIADKDPDIIAIQEYYQSDAIQFSHRYKYIKTKSKANKFGLAIFSKYKIINSGSLNFEKSTNNAIYIDVLKGKDTIRVYNIHLESLKINPKKENFGEKDSEKLIQRLKTGFTKQVSQTEQFSQHEKEFKGKKIVCSDLNNTAYSWAYRQISKNKKDAFIEAGKGTGKSFNYPFPVRIDFILTDKTATINKFKTFAVKYSDHYPILARVNWENPAE